MPLDEHDEGHEQPKKSSEKRVHFDEAIEENHEKESLIHKELLFFFEKF